VTLILGVFGAVGAALLLGGRRLGRGAFLVGAVPPLVGFAWAAARLPGVLDGRPVTEHVSWVPQLGLAVDLRLDPLAAAVVLLVCGIGALVLLYAPSYFDPATADLGRLAGLLVLFGGAMVGLVVSDHLLTLYVFWEATSIASYLLIGNRHTMAPARAAALHALLVTGAGGLAMLAGFVLLGQAGGTYRLSQLGPGASNVVVVLILAGALTKSAQYPFHAWLPGAMAAPTPVSAYLHSATMVKAGVYLIARLAPVLAATGAWRPIVLVVGSVSMLAGGLRALRQHDLKLLLAHGTISQLGLLVVLLGAGVPALTEAGIVLLVGHALFKATLFLVVGVVDHETGTRDLRELPALDRRTWWPVELASLLATLSMAGIPLGLGFVAKEAAYDALLDQPFTGSTLVLVAAVVGAVLTAAYAARFHLGVFVRPRHRAPGAADPPVRFAAPAVVLAVAGLVVGSWPGLLDDVAGGHLAVWHGVNPALGLSGVALALAGILVWRDRVLQRALAAGAVLPPGGSAFLAILRVLGEVARRVTGTVQNGSLPVYAGVVLGTAALLPGAVLATRWDGYTGPPIVGRWATVPVVAVLVFAAVGASSVRWRFSAALFLGLAGYAMAGLFVVYGAPDLALTQAAIETLSTVLFVLVLRRLPDRFERQSTPRRRVVRLAVAAAVGLSVFGFALAASGSRTAPPDSGEMVARAVPDGHGKNVVNVILVDFRGLDTLGEITVLAAASIGAVALARVGRRAAGARSTRAWPRVVFLDVSAQIIFHAVLIGALWLLFAGHNQPGGGFVAGLLAGSAISLRYLAGGIDEVRALSRFAPWTVLGSGLLVSATTAFVPVVLGRPVLDVAYRVVDLPVVGPVSLSSALVFDVGVFLVVVGMVLMVFEAFGEEPQETLR
jgi:multicomponent Na+:H+ antiporter subunit A